MGLEDRHNSKWQARFACHFFCLGRVDRARTFLAALLIAGLPALVMGAAPLAAAGEAQATETTPAVPEPDGYRMDNYRSPVPQTLKGARVIDTQEAEDLWSSEVALFIDVYPQPPKPPDLPAGTIWRMPKHESIAGASWLANVGYGVLSADAERYFREGLKRLTRGDVQKPLVFFCLRDCWMSWNAARRALEMGYRNVLWFPDGTDGWKEMGLPVDHVTPEG